MEPGVFYFKKKTGRALGYGPQEQVFTRNVAARELPARQKN
jgi:hypothetical protein